jgi:phosphate uptake regulator
MLRELMTIFRSGDPLTPLGENFTSMVEISADLTVRAGRVYFGEEENPLALSEIRREDVKVNKLQRKIRKRVVTHLSASGNTADLPYCLLLMSLVKDVERIGDYAKELSEVREFAPADLQANPTSAELQRIRAGVDEVMTQMTGVLARYDTDQAVKLIRRGRGLTDRADSLLHSLASESFDGATQTALVLGTQYYKRLCGHALNVLSSVVVPLHRLDYYDEEDIAVSRQVD